MSRQRQSSRQSAWPRLTVRVSGQDVVEQIVRVGAETIAGAQVGPGLAHDLHRHPGARLRSRPAFSRRFRRGALRGANVPAQRSAFGDKTTNGSIGRLRARCVADDVGSGCAVSFNIMVDAKIATMNNITLRVRKAAIVLAAVKGEALTRRPDGRPLESLSEGRLWTAAVRDGRMSFGRDEGMARALTEQRKGRRFVNLATLSIPLIGPKGRSACATMAVIGNTPNIACRPNPPTASS